MPTSLWAAYSAESMSPIALFALHADHNTMLSSVSSAPPSAAPNIRGTQPEYGVSAPSENV